MSRAGARKRSRSWWFSWLLILIGSPVLTLLAVIYKQTLLNPLRTFLFNFGSLGLIETFDKCAANSALLWFPLSIVLLCTVTIPLRRATLPSPTLPGICVQCATRVREKAKFCHACGSPMAMAMATASVSARRPAMKGSHLFLFTVATLLAAFAGMTLYWTSRPFSAPRASLGSQAGSNASETGIIDLLGNHSVQCGTRTVTADFGLKNLVWINEDETTVTARLGPPESRRTVDTGTEQLFYLKRGLVLEVRSWGWTQVPHISEITILDNRYQTNAGLGVGSSLRSWLQTGGGLVMARGGGRYVCEPDPDPLKTNPKSYNNTGGTWALPFYPTPDTGRIMRLVVADEATAKSITEGSFSPFSPSVLRIELTSKI